MYCSGTKSCLNYKTVASDITKISTKRYEANISTAQTKTSKYPWFQGSHGLQKGARDPESPACQRSSQAECEQRAVTFFPLNDPEAIAIPEQDSPRLSSFFPRSWEGPKHCRRAGSPVLPPRSGRSPIVPHWSGRCKKHPGFCAAQSLPSPAP